MTDIARHLYELKEADMDTWKDIRFNLVNIFSVGHLEDINTRSPLMKNTYSDIIQGGIQRAVAAIREKDFEKDCFFDIEMVDRGQYEARIYNRTQLLARETATEPATAILAAYIQARKAMG